MKHLNAAKESWKSNSKCYLEVIGSNLRAEIQNGTINSKGVNGMQVTELLEYVREVYVSLNREYPCRENSLTITHIDEAINWQYARTRDREGRGVEGLNKA